MAPEQMTGKAVGRRADVWAVGGLALLCATGDPPWKRKGFKTPYALMMAVCKSTEAPPVRDYHLAPDLQDFIERCFARDPNDRPRAEALLEHPFLRPAAPPRADGGRRDPNLETIKPGAPSSALKGLAARLSARSPSKGVAGTVK